MIYVYPQFWGMDGAFTMSQNRLQSAQPWCFIHLASRLSFCFKRYTTPVSFSLASMSKMRQCHQRSWCYQVGTPKPATSSLGPADQQGILGIRQHSLNHHLVKPSSPRLEIGSPSSREIEYQRGNAMRDLEDRTFFSLGKVVLQSTVACAWHLWFIQKLMAFRNQTLRLEPWDIAVIVATTARGIVKGILEPCHARSGPVQVVVASLLFCLKCRLNRHDSATVSCRFGSYH